MTATPIPRTAAMTVYGDLDVTEMRGKPGGRVPIETVWVTEAATAWERVREEVAAGRQAYVVCPLIEESEKLEVRSAQATFDELLAGPLSMLRLGLLHGRLKPADKEATMDHFRGGRLDVLVATTVIEVGVDVPNATVMVILDADRFGVSRLHQLRGRVGRGGLPGLCLLVTRAEQDSPAMDRLSAVAATTDGFELSRVDLEQRREGDVLGAAQSGRRSGLRLLSVLEHEDVIAAARGDAAALVAQDPGLETVPDLADAVRLLRESEQADYLEKA
jgi:ATP-dependent DNA helicase RecG